MSEIRAGSIAAANGTDPIDLTAQNAAKAHWSYDQATGPTVHVSSNVSSITDSAAGTYIVNYTNNMANANNPVVALSTTGDTDDITLSASAFTWDGEGTVDRANNSGFTGGELA